MPSLVGKYVETVRGETSAASAIADSVVAANPSRANSSRLTLVIVARVRSFLRALSPVVSTGRKVTLSLTRRKFAVAGNFADAC